MIWNQVFYMHKRFLEQTFLPECHDFSFLYIFFSSSSCTITPSPCIQLGKIFLLDEICMKLIFVSEKNPFVPYFFEVMILHFSLTSISLTSDFNYKLTIAIKLKSIQDITKIPQKNSFSTKEREMHNGF